MTAGDGATSSGLLAQVRTPADLKRLSPEQLDGLAAEIRDFLVAKVSRTGGHLGPNLGVVELTIALHRVFDSPTDRVLFDTGHQAYVHKILTGRHDEFDRLRKRDGLSGYPNQAESDHDVIENSHASTALSYADGLAKAYALKGEPRHVVAVVGDGALTGGMCWEALNNIAAAKRSRLVVVVNDNGRSYAPTIGGLADHLATLRLNPQAEADEDDCLHSPSSAFDPETGKPLAPSTVRWTGVFADELVKLADERSDIVGITAAMSIPTGISKLAAKYPHRVFDVGIAEQHAATSAAGLALGGLHPVAAIYATFLNRAFDQVLLDVAMHKLPVTFVLDRAGITGPDGPSHYGIWDLSVFGVVPGLRIAAPRDAATLREELREAVGVSDGPTLVRFPTGAVPADLPAVERLGAGPEAVDVLHRASRRDVLLVAVGAFGHLGVEAAQRIAEQGYGVTVVDPRWVRPVQPRLLELAREHRLVVTVEDGIRTGGFGTAMAQAQRDADVPTPVRDVGVAPGFHPHGSRAELLSDLGLTSQDVARQVTEWLSRLDEATTPHPALDPR